MSFTTDDFKGFYIHRYSGVSFAGKSGFHSPQRKGNEIDACDLIFRDKSSFDLWFKHLQLGLAGLDEPMNFNEYFVREKGNEGDYVRDDKSFPVNGLWDGQHLDCSHSEKKGFVCCSMREFSQWLTEHGFRKDWWKLRESYKSFLENYRPQQYLILKA